MESLGEKIKNLRLATGVSLRQFAGDVGITPAFMSDIELGRRYPSDDVLKKISQKLCIPFEELKSCDARESLTELKRMAQGDARWAVAFRTVADQIKQTGLTPEELVKKLSS